MVVKISKQKCDKKQYICIVSKNLPSYHIYVMIIIDYQAYIYRGKETANLWWRNLADTSLTKWSKIGSWANPGHYKKTEGFLIKYVN